MEFIAKADLLKRKPSEFSNRKIPGWRFLEEGDIQHKDCVWCVFSWRNVFEDRIPTYHGKKLNKGDINEDCSVIEPDVNVLIDDVSIRLTHDQIVQIGKVKSQREAEKAKYIVKEGDIVWRMLPKGDSDAPSGPPSVRGFRWDGEDTDLRVFMINNPRFGKYRKSTPEEAIVFQAIEKDLKEIK